MKEEKGENRLLTEPLGRRHDRAAFFCGVETLDRYLKAQARQDAKKNVAAPIVLVREGNATILGFYTLSMTSVALDALPDDTTRKLPRYPEVPAVLIGRLAVDREHRGCGYGRDILIDALARCLANEIAWAVVIVDAKDEAAVGFYERYGFIRFRDERRRLFMPRETAERAIG